MNTPCFFPNIPSVEVTFLFMEAKAKIKAVGNFKIN
jgi:hypothetical protein